MKICCENLSKTYISGDGQTVHAVKNCSLTWECGRIACILGVSGSGKSTLLEMLSLNLAPDSGRILFDGRDVTALGEKEQSRLRREEIGYLPQSLGLIPLLTVRENIRLPHMISGSKAAEQKDLCNRLGITDFLDRLPGELSGGQKQKAAAARELSRDIRIFLADEPTSALDRDSWTALIGEIKSLCERGCTVIFTTHDENLCVLADDVCRMEDGILRRV